jgi:transposase-like protein
MELKMKAVKAYHPDYGLPDEVRQRAVAMSKEAGVEFAAAYFNVSMVSIYKWRKDLEQ